MATVSDARRSAEPRIPFATAAFVAASMAPDAEGVARMHHLADKRQPVPTHEEARAAVNAFVRSAGIDRAAFRAALAERHDIEIELLAEADALIGRLMMLEAGDKARWRRVNRMPPPVPRTRIDPPAGGYTPEPEPLDPKWEWFRQALLALPRVETAANADRERRLGQREVPRATAAGRASRNENSTV